MKNETVNSSIVVHNFFRGCKGATLSSRKGSDRMGNIKRNIRVFGRLESLVPERVRKRLVATGINTTKRVSLDR